MKILGSWNFILQKRLKIIHLFHKKDKFHKFKYGSPCVIIAVTLWWLDKWGSQAENHPSYSNLYTSSIRLWRMFCMLVELLKSDSPSISALLVIVVVWPYTYWWEISFLNLKDLVIQNSKSSPSLQPKMWKLVLWNETYERRKEE